MQDYLLEIGVEELPSRYVDNALMQIENLAKNILNENLVEFDNIKTYATPRRLVLFIKSLALQTQKKEEIVRGPSAKIAFDEQNNPSKALMGFMKSQGVELKDTYVDKVKDTEYVFAKKIIDGKNVKDILKNEMPNLIRSIHFDRTMKWGGKNLKFARPIRWILSILGSETLEFELEGIVASNKTRGHRFLGKPEIIVNYTSSFEKLLEENFVILDQNKRREAIKYGSKKLAKSVGGQIEDDEDLLTELTYIVEYPTPLMGSVNEEYLSLPKVVVTTPMREHLRYIPVYNENKDLMPYFITIRNGNSEFKETVIEGNEKVLAARLEDAKFFYKEDIRKSSEDYIEDLKGITFQEKLGTIYEKTKRVGKLSEDIGNSLDVGEETISSLRRAAYLSKFDLATKMVQEFTELQGTIGTIYSRVWKESEIVSKSIEEQYMPRYAGGELPATTTGSILAIADKLDTIVGLFAIGLNPSGSQDPFGLRRNAIGIINIIRNKMWDLSLAQLVDFSLYAYVSENNLVFDYENVKEEILNFFISRIKTMLLDRGDRYDIVEASVSAKTSLLSLFELSRCLDEYFKSDLKNEIEAFTRIKNIVDKNPVMEDFNEELLKDKEEKELYEAYSKIKDSYYESVCEGNYKEGLDTIFSLQSYIHNFFDNIMVMVDDEEIKNNRLLLLSMINKDLGKILDISKIIQD
ncbi:glycine--tRNA ligase, beta subunit [Clostridiales bacterium KA00134]|nr:glycine--tRNA ligase, beta subunit [Clostridiales bacterium KA00134]